MDANLKRGILSNFIGWLILAGFAWAMNLLNLAAVSLAINYAVFLIHALPQNSEKFFDATGSITYLALVCTALAFSSGHELRQLINPIMVMVWCIRLGSYLLQRIMKDGKDSRFDEMKKNWLRFLGVWTIQSIWCFLVASPALIVVTSKSCATASGPLDYVGWATWLLGFLFEVIADKQKEAFRADPSNKGKFITTGLWAHSRHPNYFGEITMWVGMCISGSSCFHGLDFLAWFSPVTTWILLLKISGVPLLEKKGEETWGKDPAYRWYMDNTPCIVPSLRRPAPFNNGDYVKISN
jgi:steroid 5-alpha reductase family enzyme